MASSQDRAVALLSVHAEFAQAILRGTKTVELRRQPPKRHVSHVVLYETAPVSAIVGWAPVERVETRSPSALWTAWGRCAGVSRDQFRTYFAGAQDASAIVLGETRKLDTPVSLSTLGLTSAPQNFSYLNGEAAAIPDLARDLARVSRA